MQYFINSAGGARLNRDYPYRTVVRMAGEQGGSPPTCFFSEAIRLLRADQTERVLLLVDGDAWGAAKKVVDEIIALRPDSIRSVKATLEPWYNSSEVLVVRTDAAEQQKAILGALRLASRVVWNDPSSTLLTAMRRKPFELVWTWCSGRRREAIDENSCSRLPTAVADFHVQARVRGGPAASAVVTMDAPACARHVMVRSSWTGAQWYDLSSLKTPVRLDLARGEWTHENVCLGYSQPNPNRASQRWNILAQAHAPSRQMLWPLPWPDLYAEYVPGWLRLDSETADHWLTNMVNMSEESRHAPLRQCTWHDEPTTAILTMVTMDNLYHALIHALPTRELFERLRPSIQGSGRSVHLLPHYTQYWPKNFSRSVGWQILARSLGVSATDFPAVAAHANALTKYGGCNCYRRMYGGHARWMPPPYMKPERRVADFRAALASSIGQFPAQRRIIFQLRHNGVRQMVNEADVVAGVAADPLVGGLVKFVVMESLSVIQQYEIITSSRALAGMHGMGLAWAMLLASDQGGQASCLEITGMWSKFNRFDYMSMSKANGVRYLRLSMPNAPECVHCYRCSYRTCGNVTANVSTIVNKLQYMARLWDAPASQNEKSHG